MITPPQPHDPDPERRIAADRIRTVLLSGNGTAQNALRPELAVDFGRAQVAACREGAPMYADIQTLGYQPLIDDIGVATEALAEAVHHSTPPKTRPRMRSVQIREAVRAAARRFTDVDRRLSDLVDQLPEGTAAHVQVAELQLTLQALLERYKTRTPPADAEAPATETERPPSASATPDAAPPSAGPFAQAVSPFVE